HRIDDLHVLFGAEPGFDSQGDTGFFSNWHDFLESVDDDLLTFGVILEVPFPKKRQQNHGAIHGAGHFDAVLHPGNGLWVRFVGVLIEFTDGQTGDADPGFPGLRFVELLYLLLPEMHIIFLLSQADLHSIETDQPGFFERLRIAVKSEGPVAGSELIFYAGIRMLPRSQGRVEQGNRSCEGIDRRSSGYKR